MQDSGFFCILPAFPRTKGEYCSVNHDHWVTPSLLLQSKTVVEKQGYVAAGTLTYLEGDLLEVELQEFDRFKLGERVQLTVYASSTKYRLRTSVIGMAEGSIAVILPPGAFNLHNEKRKAPRISVSVKGRLLRKPEQSPEPLSKAEKLHRKWAKELQVDRLDEGLVRRLEALMNDADAEEPEDAGNDGNTPDAEGGEMEVVNMSLDGIGFQVHAGSWSLCPGDWVEAVLYPGFELDCLLEIIREVRSGGTVYYGARFGEMREEQVRSLRAFILREQVAAYYQMKQQNDGKRASSG